MIRNLELTYVIDDHIRQYLKIKKDGFNQC